MLRIASEYSAESALTNIAGLYCTQWMRCFAVSYIHVKRALFVQSCCRWQYPRRYVLTPTKCIYVYHQLYHLFGHLGQFHKLITLQTLTFNKITHYKVNQTSELIYLENIIFEKSDGSRSFLCRSHGISCVYCASLHIVRFDYKCCI
ncbi:Hypothetical_protein [Hexamita inflata]|uniref:Hypothetical_protein n=1 Tax=Hexamita inflata TaxID=28002 RepID=A0AA86QCW2_9EUKA|nr:Hypothetical protein HINF_LOCUS43303 [Hexamita inflata]